MGIYQQFSTDRLQWLPEVGIGYFPVREMPYDAAYFDKYVRMADTEIGRKLTEARVALVNKYTDGQVLDIGIGSGAFVQARPNTYGYDINPVAVEWLADNRLYRHPFRGADALAFWDSLEHIPDPTLMLQGARQYVFVSCPIYDDVMHILRSKHYRPDEHCWYWTIHGLFAFMSAFGFEPVEMNRMETELGREDIGTFVFKRTA